MWVGEWPRWAQAASKWDCVKAGGVGGLCNVWCGFQVVSRDCVEPNEVNKAPFLRGKEK